MVKFTVYLNRNVFVMSHFLVFCASGGLCFLTMAFAGYLHLYFLGAYMLKGTFPDIAAKL